MLRPATVSPPEREMDAALPLLEACFRGVVRRLRTRLLNRSGCDALVRLEEVRPTTVADLLGQPEVTAGVLWVHAGARRGDLQGCIVVDGPLLDEFVGRLFGSASSGTSYRPHPLTEVELRVGTRICDELFAAIVENWPVEPAPPFAERATTSTRPPSFGPTSTTPVVAATVVCGPEEEPVGRLTIVLPTALLRGIHAPAAPSVPPPAKVQHYDRLMPVSVEVVVELARVTTTLRALQELALGDEIPLGPTREVRALVNGRPTLAGEAGLDGDQRSFRVARRLEGKGPADDR